MAYLNRLTLVGRTVEVSAKTETSGAPALRFRLGVERDGQEQITDYFAGVMYGERAQAVARWLRPGVLVLVEGSVRLSGPPATPVLEVAVRNVIALGAGAPVPGTSRVGGISPLVPVVPRRPDDRLLSTRAGTSVWSWLRGLGWSRA